MKLTPTLTSSIKFEIIKKWWKIKKYYFRIKSLNGNILCSSIGYYNKKDVEDTINTIKENAYNSPVNFIFDN